VIEMSDGLTVPFALAAGRSGAVDNTSIIVIFFENRQCVSSDHPLTYQRDLGVVGSLRYWGIDSSGCD
jgi:hypothetical protein